MPLLLPPFLDADPVQSILKADPIILVSGVALLLSAFVYRYVRPRLNPDDAIPQPIREYVDHTTEERLVAATAPLVVRLDRVERDQRKDRETLEGHLLAAQHGFEDVAVLKAQREVLSQRLDRIEERLDDMPARIVDALKANGVGRI